MIDMLPTTLDLAGMSAPPHVQGRSFAPACLARPFNGPKYILLEMNNNPRWSLDFIDWRAVVSHRWKYAYFETGHELLYDSWGPGRELEQRGGKDLQKLRQEYAIAVATRRAQRQYAKQGFKTTRENQPNGRVRVKLVRR